MTTFQEGATARPEEHKDSATNGCPDHDRLSMLLRELDRTVKVMDSHTAQLASIITFWSAGVLVLFGFAVEKGIDELLALVPPLIFVVLFRALALLQAFLLTHGYAIYLEHTINSVTRHETLRYESRIVESMAEMQIPSVVAVAAALATCGAVLGWTVWHLMERGTVLAVVYAVLGFVGVMLVVALTIRAARTKMRITKGEGL